MKRIGLVFEPVEEDKKYLVFLNVEGDVDKAVKQYCKDNNCLKHQVIDTGAA